MNGEASPRAPVRHVVITAEAADRRLDNFLASLLGDVPRTLVYRIIRTGEVRVNGGRGKPAQKLVLGDTVRVPPIRSEPKVAAGVPAARIAAFEGAVLFENDHVIVVDKPAGLAVHAGSGIPFGLIDVARAARPGATRLDLVHRLDRQTSGCLLLAKDAPTLRALNAQLAAREFRKIYVALLAGHLARRRMTVSAPLDVAHRRHAERHTIVAETGRDASTEFRVQRRYGESTLVEAEPATGRTHQIRAHAVQLGHPLAGDDKYGEPDFNRRMAALGLRRLFLHAAILEFELAGRHRIEAPLPADLHNVLAALESNSVHSDKESA